MKTSPHISDFNTEGQALVKSILFTKDRWNPEKVVPWDIVKEKWLEKWDLNKPILLEKSPPHLIRAKQLETNFPDSYFLIMVRNPYAFCVSVKQRWGKRFTYNNLAKYWSICAGYQIENTKNLKHKLWFTYEYLTDEPDIVCHKIMDFIPQVGILNPKKKFDVSGKSMDIINLNHERISHLTNGDIFEINHVLKKCPSFMAFFNYHYIDAREEKIKFKIAKKIFILVRSMFQLPGPVRWHK